MGVPFSLPLLDQAVVDEVVDALTNTGWITTGPKVQQFEKAIREYTRTPAAVAVNSWTSGAMVALRWFGVGPGDEVIVPAYTYCATALAAMNMGATPVMIDVEEPFHLSLDRLAQAITPRTKCIIPVDLGGWPCDYSAIRNLLGGREVARQFVPQGRAQESLGRPLILADAAHSLGASQGGRPVGTLADLTVFSFHSVKNLTTGEGGMICLNLPEPFKNVDEERVLRYLSLNGQTKSALEKSTVGGWRYDIVDQGFKANMPDLCAAVGLAQIRHYEADMLPERRLLFETYNESLSSHTWAILPPMSDDTSTSSLHLYQLRMHGISEASRNQMMQLIADEGFGVNVHYVPLPMLTLFKKHGYRMEDYPNAFRLYQNEITLPVYNRLAVADARAVAESVIQAYTKVTRTRAVSP